MNFKMVNNKLINHLKGEIIVVLYPEENKEEFLKEYAGVLVDYDDNYIMLNPNYEIKTKSGKEKIVEEVSKLEEVILNRAKIHSIKSYKLKKT